jgi:hypothetical protein
MLFTHLEHGRRVGWDLGRSTTSPPLQTLLTVIYLIRVSIGLIMAEFKTIISANIPVTLAERLKDKTKGTRSRTITRALKAYLDEKDAFDIEEIPTKKLLLEIMFRDGITPSQKEIIRQIYLEMEE